LAILTALVIATIIITGVYVGYHAYETSLHEEVKEHSIPIEIQTVQSEIIKLLSNTKPVLTQGIF